MLFTNKAIKPDRFGRGIDPITVAEFDNNTSIYDELIKSVELKKVIKPKKNKLGYVAGSLAVVGFLAGTAYLFNFGPTPPPQTTMTADIKPACMQSGTLAWTTSIPFAESGIEPTQEFQNVIVSSGAIHNASACKGLSLAYLLQRMNPYTISVGSGETDAGYTLAGKTPIKLPTAVFAQS
jgi:hypothetical protein